MLRLKSRKQEAKSTPSDVFVLPGKDELLELMEYMTPDELKELDKLLAPQEAIEWMPQPGPQTLAFYSNAQMLLYGGAAGGGKTDLLLGLGYRRHYRGIIFRREFVQFTEMIDRSEQIFGMGAKQSNTALFRGWLFPPTKILVELNGEYEEIMTPYGKKLEFGSVKDPGDERKYQGRPHDYKAFDEVTHFRRTQFDYLRGWLRTVLGGLNWQIAATCNPPTHADERWIFDYWPNWIDKRRFSSLETPGKLLWFIMREGKSFQVDGPGTHQFKNRTYTAMSRTFIPSSVKDNAFLDDGQYESVLDSLPEPLRSQLLHGDFQAGITDDAWQLIPTEWILAAMARWREREEPKDRAIEQSGVDIARGGKDQYVQTNRRGNYFCAPIVIPGKFITDGEKAAQTIFVNVMPKTLIVIDEIGVGTSAYDFMKKIHDQFLVNGFIGSAESVRTDKSGMLGFINQRAEGYWFLREDLDPNSGMDLALPDDPELLAELVAIQWQITPRGIKIISKEDIIAELGRSPDKADSLMYAHHQPFRRGQGLFDYMKDSYAVAKEIEEKKLAEEKERRENMVKLNDMTQHRTDGH